jgi:UDP-GlcNAc:undecaprenyl-phosphate GlcNAc-1-phosphate transferase
MEINQLQPYEQILPLAIIAFLLSILLTPLVGYIAGRFKFIDLPPAMRKRTDTTLEQRIHKEAKLRLGGLAVMIPFIILTLFSLKLSPQIIGILVGLGLLIIVGAIDDKYELSGGMQFLFQFIAAGIVVISGISITGISVSSLNLDFVSSSSAISLFGSVYLFRFPADLITIIWIMTIINALNWVGGIDALGEGMTFIAAIAIMILSIRVGHPEIALLAALLAGGMLGFTPYNFPPSRIMSGTAGHTGAGFLLAVLSIISGAKITSAIILLSIPLADMAWVLFNRIRQYRTINIFKLFSISGRVHLHHRLMSLGFSAKQTLYIETSAMGLISIVALYFGDFNSSLITIVAVMASLLILFTMIAVQTRIKPKKTHGPKEPSPPIVDTGPSPEQRYAY